MEENNMTLEDMLEALAECTDKMENSSMSLEESFETFKKGMELVKQSNDCIDKVEKQVMMLMDDGTLEPLDK